MRPACGATETKPNQTTEEYMSTTLSALQYTPAQNILHACLASCCANTDATAIAITSAIYHIYQNSITLKRMRNHLDAGIAAGLISNHITADQARGMHYLQAVLKEALRMRTSSASPHSWIVSKDGVVFDSHKLPLEVRSPNLQHSRLRTNDVLFRASLTLVHQWDLTSRASLATIHMFSDRSDGWKPRLKRTCS